MNIKGATSSKAFKMLVIDPDGDIVLVLTHIEIQVSSKTLTLASPVFKVLFGPHFAEAKSATTCQRVRRIRVLGDNSGAMSLLCTVLHHQVPASQVVTLETLENLGIVADKYDCLQAVHHLAKCAIHDLKEINETGRLLWPAYIFDHAVFFTLCTKYLVYDCPNYSGAMTSSGRYGIPEEVQKLLPREMTGKFHLNPSYIATIF